jgi:hypothetical protein
MSFYSTFRKLYKKRGSTSHGAVAFFSKKFTLKNQLPNPTTLAFFLAMVTKIKDQVSQREFSLSPLTRSPIRFEYKLSHAALYLSPYQKGCNEIEDQFSRETLSSWNKKAIQIQDRVSQ